MATKTEQRQRDPLQKRKAEEIGTAAVNRILAEHYGAWGAVETQREWLIGVIATEAAKKLHGY